MKIDPYNQYLSRYTKNACAIVSLLQVFKHRYAILVAPSFLIKTSIYLDKIKVFNIVWWATFSILDNAVVFETNRRLKLKFKLVTRKISTLSKKDYRTFQFWIKWYSTYKFDKIRKSWSITKADIDYLCTFTWWSWHAAAFDMSASWYYIDSDWEKNCRMSLEVLQYWVKRWVFRDNCRTIDPVDEETKQVCYLTIQLFKAEKRNRLAWFYKKESYNSYLKKAKELYFYWR